MPTDNWGTPGRDTFQLEAHEHFLAFLNSDTDQFKPPYIAIQNKLSHPLQPQRIRTWKKLFEKMGVLNVQQSVLRLTDFGYILQEQLSSSTSGKIENNNVIAESTLRVLGKYQLKNPTSRMDFDERVDVFPYWVIWKAMRELENKLHWEELNRVILRIMRMSQLPEAIEKIKKARKTVGYFDKLSETQRIELLEQKVDLPQRSRAMSAIYSEAGFGGCIIERRQRKDGYRYLNATHLKTLDEVIKVAPKYVDLKSKENWYCHYGKLTAKSPFRPLRPATLKVVERTPEEVIDTVAEAYLVESKSHREIQKSILKKPAPKRGGGFKAMAILHYLGLDDSTKGLFRKLPTPAEADAILSEKVPWLNLRQKHRVISALEGFKATREAEKFIKDGYFHGDTEKESYSSRRVRRQQNKLRDLLLVTYGCKCAVCDIDSPDLLRAGHIIPWAVDKENRLNPSNAILLCVLHDKLFESGLISLDDQLNILISEKLKSGKSVFLKKVTELCPSFKAPKTNNPGKKFLEYHRKNIFL